MRHVTPISRRKRRSTLYLPLSLSPFLDKFTRTHANNSSPLPASTHYDHSSHLPLIIHRPRLLLVLPLPLPPSPNSHSHPSRFVQTPDLVLFPLFRQVEERFAVLPNPVRRARSASSHGSGGFHDSVSARLDPAEEAAERRSEAVNHQTRHDEDQTTDVRSAEGLVPRHERECENDVSLRYIHAQGK